MGQSPPSESYNEEKRGLPFYQGVTDFGATYPNPTVWCTDPKKIAESDSILFSVRAPVGKTNLTKMECCIGRGIASFNTIKNSLLYCFYLISQNKKNFSVYAQGTTHDAINREDVEKTKLPLTGSIKEQQRIASILSGVGAPDRACLIIATILRMRLAILLILFAAVLNHEFHNTKKNLYNRHNSG